jgi:PKD repeat protein
MFVRRVSRAGWASLLALSLVGWSAASGPPAGAAGTSRPASASALCGSLAGTAPNVTKVLWIFMENTSYGPGSSQIPGSPSAPYIKNTLMAQCGSTSNYHAATHPSYPNYLSATSGSTQGWSTDKLGYFTGPNIFAQADPSWRSYQEYMQAGCAHVSQTGTTSTLQYYVGKHNPAASYSSLPVGAPSAGDCPQFDEPLGTTTSGALIQDVTNGTLPRFGFITPGLCNDMHLFPTGVAGCPSAIASGDSWLSTWIPILTSGPDYANGNLVIDIAWDEGRGGTAGSNCISATTADCIVPNIVISPYTTHVVSSTNFSHYSLLKMAETLLGLPYLGGAADPATNDLCVPFGLCPPTGPGPPTASFTTSCTVLSCSFDGSGSTAPRSTITSYAWDFGDGSTGTGQTTTHAFAASGTTTVRLTVTNGVGATASTSQQVTVNDGTGAPISFVASAAVTGNATQETVTVPPAVTAGDGMLLFATGASSGALTGPPGWTLVGTSTNTAITTNVWSRVAAAGDPGQPVTVGFVGAYKGNVQLVAYAGTSAAGPVSAFAATAMHVTTSTATTPAATVTASGAWVVSYWAAKSSVVNTWTAPSGQSVRSVANGSLGGRINSLVTDGGAPAAFGPVGGLAATTDQDFAADTAWTVVLAGAVG